MGLSRGGNDSPILDEVKSVWVSPWGESEIPIMGLSRGGNGSPILDEVKSVWVSPVGGVCKSPLFGYPRGESLSLWDGGTPYRFRVWGLGFWGFGFWGLGLGLGFWDFRV